MAHLEIVRYIDDACAYDEMPPQELYGMEYKCTSEEGKPITFLGMQIALTTQGEIQMREYDKQRDFPFMIIQYPKVGSNIPKHQGVGDTRHN